MTGGFPHVPEPFRLELEPHRETIVLVARGEIDVMSADPLAAQLRELLDAGFRRVVLDLRDVSFMDSTGLRVVLDADAASRRAGVEFALIEGTPPVQRLFQLTQTDDVLQFVDAHEIDGGAG